MILGCVRERSARGVDASSWRANELLARFQRRPDRRSIPGRIEVEIVAIDDERDP
jgi:hypothetical protein